MFYDLTTPTPVDSHCTAVPPCLPFGGSCTSCHMECAVPSLSLRCWPALQAFVSKGLKTKIKAACFPWKPDMTEKVRARPPRARRQGRLYCFENHR